MKISILGSSITDFGELWDKSLEDLFASAIDGALQHAHLDSKDIEAVFVANMAAGSLNHQRQLNALVAQHFPHYPPAMRLEAACASGGVAMLAAEYALLAGQFKTVLVVGAEKMTDVSSPELTNILSSAAYSATEQGSTFPTLYALFAQHHMHKYGTTRRQLSSVVVKNHLHALDNPHAQFHKKLTIEQVEASAVVATPLHLLDCSPITDGAAAVILTTNAVSKKPTILGWGQGQDSLDLAGRDSLDELRATRQAAEKAYTAAQLSAKDIQVAEVHDCFTIAELFAIEDLGFVPKGQAGRATENSLTTYGGQVVVNPSGGLKASGHPTGATGVKQVAYLAQLLEKQQYQYGLTHNVGGSGATAVVHILGGTS